MIQQQVEDAVKLLQEKIILKKIYFTGHSLGAALSSMLSFFFFFVFFFFLFFCLVFGALEVGTTLGVPVYAYNFGRMYVIAIITSSNPTFRTESRK